MDNAGADNLNTDGKIYENPKSLRLVYLLSLFYSQDYLEWDTIATVIYECQFFYGAIGNGTP